MKRILILGGGVGGTLTANLLVKKLRRRVEAGEVTITVVDESNRSAEVRLQGIDAPEHGQALAPASQAHLSHLVFGKQVELDCICLLYTSPSPRD